MCAASTKGTRSPCGTAPGQGSEDFPRWAAERPRTAETRVVVGGWISLPAPHGSHRGEEHGRPQAAPAPSGFASPAPRASLNARLRRGSPHGHLRRRHCPVANRGLKENNARLCETRMDGNCLRGKNTDNGGPVFCVGGRGRSHYGLSSSPMRVLEERSITQEGIKGSQMAGTLAQVSGLISGCIFCPPGSEAAERPL